MTRRRARGFTLVEVLVALVVVAMGLTALMLAVSGTASASGYLRDKAIAQWIALNRLTEVRLNLSPTKLAQSGGSSSGIGSSTSSIGSTSGGIGSTSGGIGSSSSGTSTVGGSSGTAGGDAGELDFAGRHWHYDTRYYDTSFASMHRVVVRVWAGGPDQKGSPLGEYTGFLGSDVASPGGSNVNWAQGSAESANCANTGTTNTAAGTAGSAAGTAAGSATGTNGTTNCAPAATTTTGTTAAPTTSGGSNSAGGTTTTTTTTTP